MGLVSPYLEYALDAMFGDDRSSLFPATLHLALFDGDPTDEGVEISGGSYARQAISNNDTNFPAATSGLKRLATITLFPTATADWGTVSYWALMSAASGGAQIATGRLGGVSAYFVSSGDTLTVPPNTVTIGAR